MVADLLSMVSSFRTSRFLGIGYSRDRKPCLELLKLRWVSGGTLVSRGCKCAKHGLYSDGVLWRTDLTEDHA